MSAGVTSGRVLAGVALIGLAVAVIVALSQRHIERSMSDVKQVGLDPTEETGRVPSVRTRWEANAELFDHSGVKLDQHSFTVTAYFGGAEIRFVSIEYFEQDKDVLSWAFWSEVVHGRREGGAARLAVFERVHDLDSDLLLFQRNEDRIALAKFALLVLDCPLMSPSPGRR